jgi:hypothetical protein
MRPIMEYLVIIGNEKNMHGRTSRTCLVTSLL